MITTTQLPRFPLELLSEHREKEFLVAEINRSTLVEQ
jgi:hypothetical protein